MLPSGSPRGTEATRSSTNLRASRSASTSSSRPEPDRQQPHEWDEIYIVLEGNGVLDVEGESIALAEGGAAFVRAGAEHRFSAYEHLAVLVFFDKSQT
jgi:mannose-6-phosphate isomerase-like protein (cupin superfamily)